MEGHLLLSIERASELFGTLCKKKKKQKKNRNESEYEERK